MRRRLLLCALFGLVGILLAVPVSDSFGISVLEATAMCVAGCGVLGYVISIIVDVFVESATEAE